MNSPQGWVAPRAHAPRLVAAALPVLAALMISGCTSNAKDGAASIAVTVSDDACTVSVHEAPAGHAVFSVKNTGSQVAEFYVYAADGSTIIAEVENIGPGLTRELVVTLDAGTYVTSCDPGMDGDDVRADFVATAAGQVAAASPERQAALDAASAKFLGYVQDEVDTLTAKTKDFADAFAGGDDERARSLYADARVHWERIEPVAEAFGDLDPSLDLREADLGPQELWMGWHRAEKALWPPASGYEVTDADRTAIAAQLVADTLDLQGRVNDQAFEIAPFAIGNGAKELLDELSTSKITGEEEVWSGTDLWDMQANIDGAFAAFDALRPLVDSSDPALVAELDQRFADVNATLATHGSLAAGFALYPELTHEQILELSRAVEALSEPLAKLTAAAVL